MSKALKIAAISLLCLLLITVAAAFIVPVFLNKHLKTTLIEEFDTQTDQNYKLDVSELRVSLFKRSVTLDSITVQSDSTSPHAQYISVASISVEGIRLLSLFSSSIPDFRSITVKEPKFDIIKRGLKSQKSSKDPEEKLKELDTFALFIENGSGTVSDSNGTEIFSISDISLEAHDIDINKFQTGSALLFIENLFIQGSEMKWIVSDNFYELTIEDFNFDKGAQSLSATNLALIPLLPKYEFSEAKGYQLDRINLKIHEINFIELDLTRYADSVINVNEIQINQPWMEVFRNKKIDRKDGLNVKPLLNELANSIDFSIGVDKTTISDGTIIYEEHKSKSDSSAAISFDDLEGFVSNIRTASHPAFFDDTLKLHVETLFMNTAPLTVDVSYPVFNETDLHTVKAKLGSLDPKVVGNMLERSGFVRVDNGQVESLDAEFILNSESSTGGSLILYRDLKISFLDAKSGEQGLKEKFKDFIANTFSIKSENIEPDPKIGKVKFDREVEKSIFAYWWKSILSGIQDTIK